MYAIVKTGGKQYRVEKGDTIYVEKLAAAAGEKVTLGEVLLLGGEETRVGQPTVKDASVVAKVLAQGRDAKVRVFKYKKRKQYRKTKGHRQAYTALQIEAIQA